MMRRYIPILLLLLLVLLVYGRAWRFDFVCWDDSLHVYENSAMNPPSVAKAAGFWKRPHEFPLTYTLWAVQARFAGLSQFGVVGMRLNPCLFHVTNVLLHLLNTALVFLIVRGLLGAGGTGCVAAVFGAALFALHPMQAEAVCWVSALKDIAGGFFALLALWLYVGLFRCCDRQSGAGGSRCVPWIRGMLATVSFVCALLAKPVAVTVPVIAWALTRMDGSLRRFRGCEWLLLGWLAAAVPWMVLSKAAQPDSVIGFVSPLLTRPVVAADALWFYLSKLVLPLGLGPDYGRSPAHVLSLAPARLMMEGLALLVLVVGLGWAWRRGRRWVLTVGIVFVAGLFPVLGLIPFGFQDISTVADRYAYLAMLGPAIGVGALLSEYGRLRLVRAFAGLCLLGLAFLSYAQAGVWRNTTTLFERGLHVNERSYACHNNLGKALVETGRPEPALHYYSEALRTRPGDHFARNNMGLALAALGRVGEAVAWFRDALAIKPDYADAHANLGSALSRGSDSGLAVAHWEAALRIRDDMPEVHNNLGFRLMERGDFERALHHYSRAIALNPYYAGAHDNLGVAFFRQGRYDEAQHQYEKALALNPAFAEALNNLGLLCSKRGDLDGAMRQYSHALRLDPNLGVAWNNLGNACLAQDKGAAALECYERALAVQARNAEALNNIGVVWARRGRTVEAGHYFSRAIEVRPGYGQAQKNLAMLRRASQGQSETRPMVLPEEQK